MVNCTCVISMLENVMLLNDSDKFMRHTTVLCTKARIGSECPKQQHHLFLLHKLLMLMPQYVR